MKSLLALIAAALLIPSAPALTPKDMMGTWTGMLVVTTKGKKSVSAPATIRFRSAAGVVFMEQMLVRMPAGSTSLLAKYDGTTEGGRFGSQTKQKGKIIESAAGFWSITDATLKISPYSSERYGTIMIKVAKSGRAFGYSASYSDGEKASGRFVRQ